MGEGENTAPLAVMYRSHEKRYRSADWKRNIAFVERHRVVNVFDFKTYFKSILYNFSILILQRNSMQKNDTINYSEYYF